MIGHGWMNSSKCEGYAFQLSLFGTTEDNFYQNE